MQIILNSANSTANRTSDLSPNQTGVLKGAPHPFSVPMSRPDAKKDDGRNANALDAGNNADSLKIPRILHHIWLGSDPLPAVFGRFRDLFQELHPNWELLLWTDNNLPPLKNQSLFDADPTWSGKSDILRHEVLARYGGLYLDTDFEPLRNIEPLLGQATCVLDTCKWTKTQAVIGGVSGDPFWCDVVDSLPAHLENLAKTNPQANASVRTGPRYVWWLVKRHQHITRLPSEACYPFGPRGRDVEGWRTWIKEGPAAFPDAYVAHHWCASWLNQEIPATLIASAQRLGVEIPRKLSVGPGDKAGSLASEANQARNEQPGDKQLPDNNCDCQSKAELTAPTLTTARALPVASALPIASALPMATPVEIPLIRSSTQGQPIGQHVTQLVTQAGRPPARQSAKRIVHFGFNNEYETNLVRRYAQRHGYIYWWEGAKNDMFKAAEVVKDAAMVVIWNGLQHNTPLAARLCRRRGIPHCFIEWGLLPQSQTFLVDPTGFCGDSILCRDLGWVTEEDLAELQHIRAELQTKHERRDEGFILVPLQIHNDSQVLYHSPFRTMEEFVAVVEAMYPGQRIIVRPHPQSRAPRHVARAEVCREGSFLDMAARASVVVGITSTTLYEAAILGVPVVALGDHPLRLRRPDEIDRVLAGVLALRLNRPDGDLSTVLERFAVRPLPSIG